MDAIIIEIEKTPEYWRYRAQARNAPEATDDTRIALVAHQLGLSSRDLESFYYVNRKGSKKRYFDDKAFAEKYGISVDWLRDGYLPAHPRNLEPIKKVRRTNNGTSKERVAKPAIAAGKSTAASAAELAAEVNQQLANASEPDRPFIEFMERLGAYVAKEFATGKNIDEIFDQLIADAIQKSRRMPPLRPR
jgi:hypothetical protein